MKQSAKLRLCLLDGVLSLFVDRAVRYGVWYACLLFQHVIDGSFGFELLHHPSTFDVSFIDLHEVALFAS